MFRPIGAVTLPLALALSACVSPESYRTLDAANAALRRNLEDLERYHKELEGENVRLRTEVERLGRNAAEADYVRQQKEELAKLIKEFQEGGSKEVPGVTVISTAEGIGFQLQGEVLFESGRAEITPKGQAVLAQLVPALTEHGRALRVAGHTDVDPIRHSQWRTNLRLSTERAIAVVEFLKSRGIDETLMHVSGYGEHRPAVAGEAAEAKRQNRRVEIMMLKE